MFFDQTAAITAAQVGESKAIPVVRGDWLPRTLPRFKVGGITVTTNDVLRGPVQPINAIVGDVTRSLSVAINFAFVNPNEASSVLYGAESFASSGSTLSAIDADLKRLVGLVPAAFRGAAAFTMSGATALYLSLLRGTGGELAYPAITPFGGTLLGLPVLVTDALEFDESPISRAIGLIDASRIFWNPGGAMLTVSRQAALEMSADPTGATDTPVTASQNFISLFQSEATAIKGVWESGWYASADAAAFMTTNY